MVHRHAAPAWGTRAKTLLLAVAGAAAISFAMASGPVSTANAAWTNSFCANAWLQPGGTCLMGQGFANHYSSFSVSAWTHAGCVAATGYHGEQVMDWACTWGGSQKFIAPPNPAGWYRGWIRNYAGTAASYSGGAYCDPSLCV